MNWFSLAYKNMKKSVRDYVVYFLTLIFGVAIFYVFNSIQDQNIMMTIAESGNDTIQLMVYLLEGISVVVAFVLGFLIIYANNFLIRRRKKEFGIYLLLGMGKRDVSKILVTETFLVGLISLAAGIGIGVFGSQFVSILVGKLFEADMSAYVFTISGGAIVKTIVNFTIIYVVVLLFHAGNLSKIKLIDLFSASRKTEKQVLRNPIVATIVFVLSAVALGMAYYKVGFCQNELDRMTIIKCIVTGIAATLLLFWSIAGFLLSMLRKIKPFYHKNLNSFVIRQFCNNVNSSAVSMGVICLMLFVTICTFSSGFTAAHEFQENMRSLTPADFSVLYTGREKVTECLAREGILVDEWSRDYVEIPVYQTESITMAIGLGDILDAAKEQFPMAKWNTPEDIIKLSDYNALAGIYGFPVYELADDEYLVVCEFALLEELKNRNLEKGGTQVIGEMVLKPAFAECKSGYLCMSGNLMNMGFVVLPDAVVENAGEVIAVTGHVLAGNYLVTDKDARKEVDARLHEATEVYTVWNYMSENPIPPMTIGTKINIREHNNGLTMMITFIVIYIGMVFLLASAALLALKALTESIDGVEKFRILKKIGCEEKMLGKCLFAQIGVYFILPLAVAVIHSVFGMIFIESQWKSVVSSSTSWGMGLTAVVILVLYGGYLLATFKNSKKIVELE